MAANLQAARPPQSKLFRTTGEDLLLAVAGILHMIVPLFQSREGKSASRTHHVGPV